MSQDEKIIRQEVNIKANDKERPSVFRIRTGTLILTKRRLIWIKGGLVDKIYRKRENYEKDLEKKGGFEIPLSSIQEYESGRYRLMPFFMVVYKTDSGTKSCSFWHSEGSDMTQWFDEINEELKEIHEPSQRKKEVLRDMIMVDQSHDQDDRGTINIAEIVNAMSNRLNLNETFAIQGRPENELLVANEHLLPRTLLLISLGTKSGDKFSQKERELIKKYVESGGRLLLTAVSPEDPPNKIVDQLELRFVRKKIEDEIQHVGRHKDHIIVKDLADHPINKGVETIRFGKFGCYPLQIENPEAVILASSSEHAEPPKAPVAALVPYGMGQVIVIGQTRLFQDDYIDEVDNRRWFENIITFLTSKSTHTQEKQVVIPAPNCSKCGIKISEGALFCSNCGAKVT